VARHPSRLYECQCLTPRGYSPSRKHPGGAVTARGPRWRACCPTSAWRAGVGLGVPLGWSEAHLRLERIPGYGTFYVIWFSAGSILAASLTLGLVYRWGEQVPSLLLLLGGRRLPVWLVAALAVAGTVVITGIIGLSIAHWSSVSGFSDRPTSGWACSRPATPRRSCGPRCSWSSRSRTSGGVQVITGSGPSAYTLPGSAASARRGHARHFAGVCVARSGLDRLDCLRWARRATARRHRTRQLHRCGSGTSAPRLRLALSRLSSMSASCSGR